MLAHLKASVFVSVKHEEDTAFGISDDRSSPVQVIVAADIECWDAETPIQLPPLSPIDVYHWLQRGDPGSLQIGHQSSSC